jgi:hypothetical protein
MSTSMRIDRRRALQMLSALGMTLAIPTGSSAATGAECGRWLSEDLELQALQALGREYSAQHADAAVSPRVSALIAKAQTDEAAIASLQELIRADYASARLVHLSHWFVSDTEGQIFAVLGACAT